MSAEEIRGFFQYEVVFWSALAAALGAVAGSWLARGLKELPGRRQAAAELLAERLARLCGTGAEGPCPSVCVSILGSIVVFAISCNVAGLVMLSASRSRALMDLSMLLALASCCMVAMKRFVGILLPSSGRLVSSWPESALGGGERSEARSSSRGRAGRAAREATGAAVGLFTRAAGGALAAAAAGWAAALASPLLPERLATFSGPAVATVEAVVLAVLARLGAGSSPVASREGTCRALRADS